MTKEQKLRYEFCKLGNTPRQAEEIVQYILYGKLEILDISEKKVKNKEFQKK